MDKKLINTLEKFSNIDGPSGFEDDVSSLFKSELKDYVNTFESDNLGSIAAIKKGNGNGPKIMIATHIDEIGFVVSEITKQGFIKFMPLGGWWSHVLLGQLLTLTTRDKKRYVGVVGSTPPHKLDAQTRNKVVDLKQVYLDLGLKDEKAVKNLGIQLGDFITPKAEFFVMNDSEYVAGKAMDNRASVALGVELIRDLKEVKHNSDIYFVGTTQEEVGLRGARTAATKWKPDIAFAIDVTIATDYLGATENQTKLGDGIALSIMDRSIIANPKLVKYIEEIAKKNKIKFCYDAMVDGGTDAGAIHLANEGVITMTLSIPSRYIHSHYAIVNIQDMLAGKELLKAFIKDIDNSKFNDKLKYS